MEQMRILQLDPEVALTWWISFQNTIFVVQTFWTLQLRAERERFQKALTGLVQTVLVIYVYEPAEGECVGQDEEVQRHGQE